MTLIKWWEYLMDRRPEDGHFLRALPGFNPNACFLRQHFTVPIRSHAATGSVPHVFGAGHGTGHTGAVKHALAAHPAVEDGSLGQSLSLNQQAFHLLAIIGKRIFLDFRRPATGHANLVSGVGSAEMDRSSG